jgi:hypothetical protein
MRGNVEMITDHIGNVRFGTFLVRGLFGFGFLIGMDMGSRLLTFMNDDDDDDDIDLRPGHSLEPPRGYGVVLS